MYRIIGGDGQEYGPVDADQVRRWLVEGRASRDSLVRHEDNGGWRALALYPELAAASVPPPVGRVVPGQKSKVAAGLLGIFLGGWGIHRFYLGFIGIGIAQIIVTILTCGIGALWGFIEGIMILCNAMPTDAEGRPLGD